MKIVRNNFAFIDGQNLHLGIKAAGWVLDFGRFRIYIQDKFAVTKAFLFIGYVPGNEGMYTQLQQFGYVLIWKPTLTFAKEGKTVIKGNVDGELILHTMIEYPNYEKAVIVSGDGDFHCLVEYLFQQGKLERVLVPNHLRFSSLLRKFRPSIVFLDGPGMRERLQKHKERE